MPHRIPTYKTPGQKMRQERAKQAAAHDPKRLAWQRKYDQVRRNKESKRIYNSDAWQRARLMQLRQYPLCYDCEQAGRFVPATHVHHIQELTEAPELAFDQDNLRSLCHPCHSLLHAARQSPTPEQVHAPTPTDGG